MNTLKPFCVESSTITKEQAQEMLDLSVKLGAMAYEGMCKCSSKAAYRHYYRDSFNFIGVRSLGYGIHATIVSDNAKNYDNNVLTYQEAMDMLHELFTPESESLSYERDYPNSL